MYQLIENQIRYFFFHWKDLFPDGSGPNNEGSWGANRGSTGLKLSACHLFLTSQKYPQLIAIFNN